MEPEMFPDFDDWNDVYKHKNGWRHEQWGWSLKFNLHGNQTVYINNNNPKGTYSDDGGYDYYTDDPELGCIEIRYLESYFEYPLFPTENEATMFKLDNGVDYPIWELKQKNKKYKG